MAIERAEREAGHRRTLVIGDFNMNPFENGMVGVGGLHAMMDKRIVVKGSRVVRKIKYDYFYNPMWGRLGDDSIGPPGTCYWSKGGAEARFWETFDQILLRPELLPFYNPEALRVLERIGATPLLKNGVIDRSISDHLPLVIRLDMERRGHDRQLLADGSRSE